MGLDAERERQGPGGDVVELVSLLRRVLAAPRIERPLLELLLYELGIHGGIGSQQSVDEAGLGLRHFDHVATGREFHPRRISGQVVVSGPRAEGGRRRQYLDAVAQQRLDEHRGPFRIGARLDDEALPASSLGELVHPRAEELVEIQQPGLAVRGGGPQRGDGGGEVLRDPIAEAQDGVVVATPAVTLVAAAIGLVSHPGGAVQGRPAIPIAGIVQIEDVADVVVPTVAVESRAVRATVHLGPSHDLILRQARVDGEHRRWEEELDGLAVVIDEDLRVPFVIDLDQGLRLALGDPQRIAIQVDLVVVVVRAHPPRRIVLQGGVRRVTLGEGVIPLHEALVALGVVGRVDDGDHVLEDRQRRAVLAGGELVGDLHRRLEGGRLVPIVGVVHPADGRRVAGDVLGIRRRGGARIAQSLDVGADLIEPRDIIGRTDHHDLQRPALDGSTIGEDAHSIGRRAGDGIDDPEHVPVVGVELPRFVAQQRRGRRHFAPVRTPAVEVELLGARRDGRNED